MPDIDGVQVIPMLQIPDNRGTVKRFLRKDDIPNGFAECYITTIYKGIIKGWHGYKTKTIHYVVPFGMVKLVLMDIRNSSKTCDTIQEIYIGDLNYCKVVIPPGVMNAFQGITDTSVIVVGADEIFDEQATWRLPIDKVDYDWTKINK